MNQEKFPFAVQLAGFPADLASSVSAALQSAPPNGPAYFCLSDYSLQEPDLVLAYGPDLKAMATLAALADQPGELDARPALVLGPAAARLPYAGLALPFDRDSLLAEMALLVSRRANALARLASAGLPPAPERRRTPRLDFDLTDPAEYAAMRGPQRRGAVLVADSGVRLYQQVLGLMQPYRIAVLTANDEASALAACAGVNVAVALVNTSLPGIDPYRLGAALRAQAGQMAPAVVLLAAPPFKYDVERAQAVGLEGLLDKPLAPATLKAVLKQLMHIA